MNRTEDKNKPELEKPEILYHASLNGDIKRFEPRKETVRDPKEGPVVFATPDKGLASIFLVEGVEDSWTTIGKFNGVPFVVICAGYDEFVKNDKGGTIYELPSDTFECDQGKGMGKSEWTSKGAVVPNNKTKYNSALETMLANGVQVYFVDENTFKAINSANDHGFRVINDLKSENQKRGINYKSFI